MDVETSSEPKRAPRGILSGRVDDRGRLKLPVDIERFLKGQELFITSLDGRIGRIYPLPLWEKNEELLFNDTQDPKDAEDLSYNADKYGGETEVDNQGRVLLPPALRKKLGIENQPVSLRHYQGAIHIYSGEVLEARDQRADDRIEEKVDKFHKKGLK